MASLPLVIFRFFEGFVIFSNGLNRLKCYRLSHWIGIRWQYEQLSIRHLDQLTSHRIHRLRHWLRNCLQPRMHRWYGSNRRCYIHWTIIVLNIKSDFEFFPSNFTCSNGKPVQLDDVQHACVQPKLHAAIIETIHNT